MPPKSEGYGIYCREDLQGARQLVGGVTLGYITTKRLLNWLHFFGGEMLFTAEIVYIQDIILLYCETTLLVKSFEL